MKRGVFSIAMRFHLLGGPWIGKVAVLLVITLLGLLFLSVFVFSNVKAGWDTELSAAETPPSDKMDITFSAIETVTYVNYPVNITAYPTGGTPPYTYQWYSALIPQELFDSPLYPHSMLDEYKYRVKIEGATSQTLMFAPSKPGIYSLHLETGGGETAGGESFGGPWIVVLPELPEPPSIRSAGIVQPENVTYETGNILLNFTVSTLFSAPTTMRSYSRYANVIQWVGYSLDGQENVTINENEKLLGIDINGNCTISGLTEGLHTITVYANDTFSSMGASKTLTFTILKQSSEAFPTVPVIAASAASLVVVGAAITVYFKKRKR